jgi:hypothetical protein
VITNKITSWSHLYLQTNLRDLEGFFEIFPRLRLMNYLKFKTTRYIEKGVNVRYMMVCEGGKAHLHSFLNWELESLGGHLHILTF